MKLKINKACDLSSISVLPPPTRRSSIVPNGAESSVFGKSQASQIRSQTSQQSFSQGISSQHGMFSQLSQNSLDEIVTNDQRISSQERENSVKKLACLPPISYSLEESQMPISRSSSNLMRKWNSTSVPDHRSQISEELEHRIGKIETLLNRFGMIMNSVQSDIMQVNKGTKEALMEIEDVRQKLIANGNLLQLVDKGQDDIKTKLVGGIKSLSDQGGRDIYGENLKEISSMISALPGQIDISLQKMKSELCKTLTQEIKACSRSPGTSGNLLHATGCSLKVPSQNHRTPNVPSAKGISSSSVQQKIRPLKNPETEPKACGKTTLVPKIEVGSWTSVKAEQATYLDTSKKQKQKRISRVESERGWEISVESDEEIVGGFSCLLEGKETGGNCSITDVTEETQRILRKARRRKRRISNTIVLD